MLNLGLNLKFVLYASNAVSKGCKRTRGKRCNLLLKIQGIQCLQHIVSLLASGCAGVEPH
jgi:hypothetical protein